MSDRSQKGFFFLSSKRLSAQTQQHSSAYQRSSITAACFMQRKNSLCFLAVGDWWNVFSALIFQTAPSDCCPLIPLPRTAPPPSCLQHGTQTQWGFLDICETNCLWSGIVDVRLFRKFALTSSRFTFKNVSLSFSVWKMSSEILVPQLLVFYAWICTGCCLVAEDVVYR